MQSVGILFRIDRLEQWPLIESIGQRQLQQDSIHLRIRIQSADAAEHLVRRCPGCQVSSETGHSDAGTGLLLVGDVHGAGRVIADPQHRQSRRATDAGLMLLDHSREPVFNGFREHLAIQAQGHAIRFTLRPACLPGRASVRASAPLIW